MENNVKLWITAIIGALGSIYEAIKPIIDLIVGQYVVYTRMV